MMKHLLRGAYIYSNGKFGIGDIAVSDSRIVISPDITTVDFDTVSDCSGYYILPGFADVHVHLREPGFSYKETVESGTLAAARGGYTAVCSMPNVNPPPDSVESVSEQLALIERYSKVNVYPYGAITRGRKGRGELSDIQGIAGLVIGFSDDGTGVQSESLMREAMVEIKKTGKILCAHCEDESLLNGGVIHDGVYARKNGFPGISSESEWMHLERDLKLVRETGCRYHLCHMSTKESVELIRKAKREGLPVTCETGPHYLVYCDEDICDNGRYKMNPPLRSRADKEALLEGVSDGTVDVIATDHAPHSAEEKNGGLMKSLMGVVGLETAFPILYTYLVKNGIISIERLVGLLSDNPRKIFGIGGKIADNEIADLSVWDLEKEYVIDPEQFATKGRSTPFEGVSVYGKNIFTVVGGKII